MEGIKPIAPIKSVMYRSPDPKSVYTYSPGICALQSGRLIGTMDMGGKGVASAFPDSVLLPIHTFHVCGRVLVSDDRGATWRETGKFPFCHARPFQAGKSIYVLGHAGTLKIIRSDDGGETWSGAYTLAESTFWHQAPANVVYVEDRVYLVMERIDPEHHTAWPVRAMRPILMRAKVTDDLTKPESWTFSSSMEFQELLEYGDMNYFGIPFYNLERDRAIDVAPHRNNSPIGWLETNVVHIEDEKHIWYDPTGRTFHLFMRAHTGRTNFCCIAKVVEKDDGGMQMEPIYAPSGKKWMYLPMPGGQMKFHILYDEPTKTYWLLSSQATDSMIKPECMPENRFGLPDNERHRLQLHFSTNCVDWCFAAMVDIGETPLMSRHYASMCISGNDLFVLSRSGDRCAMSAHNGNMITLHEIKDFRKLLY